MSLIGEILTALGGLPINHITIPVKTVSEANVKEHWATRAKRAASQRKTAYDVVVAEYGQNAAESITGPIVVKIVRVGKRRLDCDNLARSNKAIRDGIADALGVDDGDERMRYHYGQRVGKEYCVEVAIC